MNELIKDFKAFILRGNVIDLAVGVAIGAAFATVVTTCSASNKLAARLASMRRWCAGSLPNRGPLRGVGMTESGLPIP